MGMERVQKHRRERLEAAAEKAGGKAALGRLLGYKDGAFVGQMLRGERPVTEETVLKLEAKPAYKGWFGAPTAGLRAVVDTAALLAAFERIGAELQAADPAARRAIASLLKDLADAPDEAPKLGVLAQRLLAPADVPMPAAKEPEVAREPEWNGVNRRTHDEPVKTERRRPPLGVIDDQALSQRPRKKAAAWAAGKK